MTKKKKHGHGGGESHGRALNRNHRSSHQIEEKPLEIVLKCDVAGTLEAVRSSISYIQVPTVGINVIHGGVGSISKSDLLMARTGSRLILGFNVGVATQIPQMAVEYGIEIRLYDVIYKLSRELTELVTSLVGTEPEEKITGKAEVIAVFKHGKGIIIGCEIKSGTIERGKHFRVITAMGPAYTGKIETLQIERTPVKSGKAGQQVGIGISNWKKVKVGDLVECFEPAEPGDSLKWRPRPGVASFSY